MKLSFREWLESLVPLNPREVHRLLPATIQVFQNGLVINNTNLSLDSLQIKDLLSHMDYIPPNAFEGSVSIRRPQGMQGSIIAIKGYNNRELGHCNLNAVQTEKAFKALRIAA